MELTDRQLEIIEAASRRIDGYGIQELTTKNLAADLRLSEAALYRHFRSKNDILMALLDYFFHQLQPGVEDVLAARVDALEKIKRFMMVPLDLFGKNPAVVAVIFSDGIFQFDQQLREKIQAIIQFNQRTLFALILEGQASGVVRTDMTPFEIAPMVMGSMRFTVMQWKMHRAAHDLHKEGCAACEAVEKMLRSPHAAAEKQDAEMPVSESINKT